MPGTYKLKTTVSQIDNVLLKYPEIEIHRSITGDEADRALFDTATLDADADQILYEFIDTGGEDNYVAWFRYHNDSGPLNSAFSSPIQYGTLASWYVSIDDLRNEKVTEAMLSNTRAITLIRQAQSTIDDATGRHFLPVSKTLKIDSEQASFLKLPEPIVKIDSLGLEELNSGGTPTVTAYEITNLRIYNRHLTQGLLRPNDREFPRIQITPEFVPNYRWDGAFPRTRQQFKIVGVFGYTELLPSDSIGETTDGSQVPLSYGSCPPLIKDAMVRLIVRWIAPHGSPELRSADEISSRIKSWKTDKQAMAFHGPNEIGVPIITGDEAVDRTLFRYSQDYSPQVGVS